MATNEEARPDVVLVLRDGEGREWLAAAYVGELERYEGKFIAERRSIHSSQELKMGITGFKVVGRE